MSSSSIPLRKAIDEFLASSQAHTGMKLELAGLARQCGSDCPLFLATGEVKGFMKGVKKAAERKKRAETLEAFFEFAKEKGWVSSNPAAGLIKKREPEIKKKPAVSKPEPIRLSGKGRQKIEAEIKELLKDKERVVGEVASAREEGDLSENAGYHDARERLAVIEAQLRDREEILARSVPLE